MGGAGGSSKKKKKQQPQIERKEGELLILFRGDSILQFRTPAKGKKLFKANVDSIFPRIFGPCQMDVMAVAGGKIRDITSVIADGVDCDILCVAIGCNDLMRSDESSIVAEYPVHLDADLTNLATA